MARSFQLALLGSVLMIAGLAVAQQKDEPAPPQTQPSQPAPATPPKADAAAPATTPAAKEPESAHLRVYRHRKYAGSALAPSIYVDDKQVVRIGNGRRACIKLSPGPHTIRSDDKSSAVSLDAKPGQEYYVRVDEETGFWKGHGKLTMLMPEQGSAEYRLQKPVEEDRKSAKEMIEDDSETASPKK